MNEILTTGAFNEIDPSDRTSGFSAEVDGSGAGQFETNRPVLIVAQGLPTGTKAPGELFLMSDRNGDDAATYGGAGSQFHDMCRAFREGNKTSELWGTVLHDNGAGNQATQAVTFTGAATKNDTMKLRYDNRIIDVGVAKDDDAAAVANALRAAINAFSPALPFTPDGGATAVVTLTYRHKGEVGNECLVSFDHVPAGVTVALADEGYFTGGTGNPVQAPAITALGDKFIPYTGFPFTDSTSLDDWHTEFLDRWGPDRMIYGKAFTSKSGTLSELQTFGAGYNSRFIPRIESHGSKSPAYLRAARGLALASKALSKHPVRPLQTLPFVGEVAPDHANQFGKLERKSLLWAGIATTKVVNGQVVCDRMVTSYQKNDAGLNDTAYLDINTVETLEWLMLLLQYEIESKFIARRMVLVDDGTPISSSVPHTTPDRLRAHLMQKYDDWQVRGYVENMKGMIERLVINRDPGNPTRVLVKFPPDLANPLIQVGMQVGFSLQWPETIN
jgi:phage tail sheath gpL-like